MILMRAARIIIPGFLVVILLFAARGIVQAQPAEVQFFPETGHTLRGEFLNYYNNAPDPKLVFGYPITEQMISRDGKTVQYFQRARFELITNAASTRRVHLTSLGQTLYTPGQPQKISNPQACKFINGTGFPICFQFLDFYRAKGGFELFGSPISPLEMNNGVLMQYFEKSRFEWRTDGFHGRVVPTDLGRIYFDVVGEDPVQRSPIEPLDAAISPVLSIRIRAYVSNPVTRPTGDQTVFVIVRSQTNQAVANASGMATVILPDGTTQSFDFVTDTGGVAQISFNFSNQKAGETVPIEITVEYQNLRANTKTSFRIWF
jgi:hypothetical protein